MDAIIINRKLKTTEENTISELVRHNTIKLFSSVELTGSLKQYPQKKIELSAEEKKKINYDIFDKVLKFGEKQVKNSSITDILSIEKASIWHYHKFRTYFYIREIYYQISLIKTLSPDFDNIYYYGNIPSLIKIPNVKFFNPDKNGISKKINIKVLLGYSFFFFLRVFLSIFDFQKLKNKKYLIIDSSLKQKILNITTLKEEYGNYYIQYLLDRVDREFIILDDVSIPKFTDSTFKVHNYHFKRKGNLIYGEPVLLRGIISKSVRKKLNKSSQYLIEQYKTLNTYLTDDFDLLILEYLSSLHKSGLIYLLKYFSYQNFFKKYHFETITSIDENSPKIKSIFDAGKSKNIKTIAIQHGTIHELHPAYMFTREDKKRKIMPDYTLVWGEHWKKLLAEKGNYPEVSLIITGQVRTDIIPLLTKTANIKTSFGISENKKLIVFASQPQRDDYLRELAAFDIFKVASKTPDTFLVVKLHPAEQNDFEYYKVIAEKAGCENFIIIYNIDLYKLLSATDILITCFSTVGAETIYFHKPLVILDHLNQDIQNYYKEEVAFKATNYNELQDITESILDGKLVPNQKAYQRFISKYSYKLDGKVSERMINLIKTL